MAARNSLMYMLVHNGCSNDTISGMSWLTESKMQRSYNWRRNDPPLPEVDTTTLLQMQRSEELHANKLWRCIQALETQIIEYNKSKYDKISQTDREVRIFYRRVNILCRHRIRLIKELWWNFYVSWCGPEPKYCQRIGQNGGTTKNSLSQMILKKVSVPVGIEGRMYWDLVLLSMTNGKFCSLRSNFKQEIFEQFQAEIWFQCTILQKHTANICAHMFE